MPEIASRKAATDKHEKEAMERDPGPDGYLSTAGGRKASHQKTKKMTDKTYKQTKKTQMSLAIPAETSKRPISTTRKRKEASPRTFSKSFSPM